MKIYRIEILRFENDIGIGIERRTGEEAEFIGSYYLQVDEFSRKGTIKFILDRIRRQLSEEERAYLKIGDPTLRNKQKWFSHYNNIDVQLFRNRKFKDATLLAIDALERKTHIEERFK